MADNEMLIDVDIPVDIEGAYDPDGLPKVVPAKKKAEPPPIRPEEVEALRRDRDAERAARTKAEADANAALEAAKTATGQLTETQVRAYGAHYNAVSGELQRIEDAIASTQERADAAEAALIAAESALANATEEAERSTLAARKAKAQREMSRAESELTALQSGQYTAKARVAEAKRYYEGAAAYAETAAREPEPNGQQQQQQQMTPEQWIDSCPAATRPWLREHREFTTDQRQYKRLLRFADEYADDHGGTAALDSADFVAALNAKFFPKQQDDTTVDNDDDATTRTETEPARTRSAPAAPVSRSSAPGGGGGGGGGGGSKVRLSADEIATAHAMYPDMAPEEARKKYATNKARAIRDGLYAPRG